MISSFKELTKEQERLAGGKGRILVRLYRAGYPVPDGFIILPAAFLGDDLTIEAWGMVQTNLTCLRKGDQAGAFAVRSSALQEDSAQASFAGEFETVLDVCTDEEIQKAIHTVRASRHNSRVQAYIQAQGMEEAEPEIAIVIQRMVRADTSGVLFTANPVTGDLMHMTGNVVPGSGEKLVSGQAIPQAFTFSRPKGTYSGPPELKRLSHSLYRIACRLEKELGGPQDIEWAIAGRRLYILQARPITTLSGYKPDTAEWNDSLTGNFLWSGTNLVENAPQVLTPFTCSLRKGLVYEGIDLSDGSTLGLDNYAMAGIIGGRGYINLSIQVSASRPFFNGDSRKALQQATAWWGGVPDDVDIPLIPISTRAWWTKVLPSLTRFGIKMSRFRKEIPQFVAENPHWCAGMCQRIRKAENGAELARLMEDEIKPYSLRAFYLANAGATDLPNRLESELRGLVGELDANALLSNLGGLASQLESLGPLTGLGKVRRGEMSRAAYLEAYGHRGVNENEYAWLRPVEDPTWIDRQLIEFAKAPVEIEALIARQQAAFSAAWERFCERYPSKVKAMQLRLEKAAQSAHQREAVRSEATRSSMVIRNFALRAGELTGVGEDIFFLTIFEVLSLLDGDDSACRFIPRRKEMYARYRASALPDDHRRTV